MIINRVNVDPRFGWVDIIRFQQSNPFPMSTSLFIL